MKKTDAPAPRRGLTATEIVPLLADHIAHGEPVMVTGMPGVGKTDCITQAAALAGRRLVTWHPVTADPTDAKGIPAIIGERAEFLPTGDLRAVMNATEPTVVLLDDLGQAPPAVQAAYMHLLLARRVNGHALPGPELVTFVVATNRREDYAGVVGILAPVVDRMTAAYQLDVDVEAWVQWGLTHDIAPTVLAFVRWRPGFLTEYAPTREMVKGPSPRSLAGAGRLIARGRADLVSLAGALGEACGTELYAYLNTVKLLPDIADILRAPDKAPVPDANRPDLCYAVAGALVGSATQGTMAAVLAYSERLPREFLVLVLKDCQRKDGALLETTAAVRVLASPENNHLFGLEA